MNSEMAYYFLLMVFFSGVSGDRFLKHDNSHSQNLGGKSKFYFLHFVNGSSEGLTPPDHLPFN